MSTEANQSQLPHNNIEGLTDEQADTFVELAYANEKLAGKIDSSDWVEGDEARWQLNANEAKLRRLANVAMGKPEVAQIPTTPGLVRTSDSTPRQGSTLVVNPNDGRIVPYGQMTHGNHPQGGMIARR